MKTLTFLGLVAGALMMAGSAQAQPGKARVQWTSDLYAGPGYDYPVVAAIPSGRDVRLHGCLRDYAWCDVQDGPYRGWVDANGLVIFARGAYHPFDTARAWYTYPIITFTFGNYWNQHYRHYPWYQSRNRYERWDWSRHSHRWGQRPTHHRAPPPRPGVRPAPPPRWDNDRDRRNDRRRSDDRRRWDDRRSDGRRNDGPVRTAPTRPLTPPENRIPPQRPQIVGGRPENRQAPPTNRHVPPRRTAEPRERNGNEPRQRGRRDARQNERQQQP